MKPSNETVHLFDHSSLNAPLHHPINVLLLVFLGYWNVPSIWLQLSFCYLSHDLLIYGERQIKTTEVDGVVVFDPLKTLVKLCIK